jgi:hypothetical protein
VGCTFDRLACDTAISNLRVDARTQQFNLNSFQSLRKSIKQSNKFA